MSYDFSKLSRVPINESVTDETYTLVVNQDDVERTPYASVVSNLKDYTGDYNAYVLSHPGTSPVDFIRTLTPIQDSEKTTTREGYLTYLYFYYEFKVFIDINNTWYKIIQVDTNNDILTEYLYNPTTLVEQVEKKNKGTSLDSGTYFITPVGFEDVRIFNCSDDADVSGDLYVNGTSHLKEIEAKSIKTKISNDKEIDIDSSSIIIKNNMSGRMSVIEDDGHGNIFFSDGDADSPIKLTNVGNPTSVYDATNKQYVDTNIAELNGRIGNLIIGGDSTEGEEIVISVVDNIEISPSYNVSASIELSGENTKLITAVWAFSGTNSWHTENVEYSTVDNVNYSISAYGLDDFFMVSSYAKFMVIYSRKANLIVPEVVDLRAPFNYTGPQGGVVSDYDSTNTQYSPGDYCYSDEEDGVRRLYICVDETDGQWHSGAWEVATARDSIELAFNSRLRLSGQDAMWGNLNMNSHKITNVTNPTVGTDAATKAYVDSKGFSLDANGILSLN